MIAELEALIGDLEVLLDRREGRRRRVRGDRLPVRAEQAVHRDAEDTALEIPERDVDDAEQPDRELLGPVELPESMPEPLAAVGPLPDELVAEDAVDDVGEHRPAPLVVGLADRAVVGRDPEDRRRAGLGRAAETLAARRTAGSTAGSGIRSTSTAAMCIVRMIIIRMISLLVKGSPNPRCRLRSPCRSAQRASRCGRRSRFARRSVAVRRLRAPS